MNKPLISIIMPTYNVEGHIARCIESCLNQNFRDFEVIVVDDYGSDRSIDIAKQYVNKDERIKIVHNEKNLGTYHGRRVGTQHSCGNFILYLDPDDQLEENALLILSRHLIKYPSLDVLLYGIQYNPSVKFWSAKPKVPVGLFRHNVIKKLLSNSRLPYGTPGKLYSRTSVLDGFNYLSIPSAERLVFGEDVLIFSSTLLHSKFALGITDKLYIYHRNLSSITVKSDTSTIESNLHQLNLVSKYLNILKGHENYIKDLNKIKKSIETNKIILRKKLCNSEKMYFKLMVQHLLKSHSWRVAINLSIFIMTFSKIKR